MYQSSTYAGQKSKSVFVEISERSAKTARLCQQGADPQPQQPALGARFLRRWVASRWGRLLEHLAVAVAPWRDLAKS